MWLYIDDRGNSDGDFQEVNGSDGGNMGDIGGNVDHGGSDQR